LKLQNKIVLAISLLISRTYMVLKTSVASITSTDMITSLASMTSTAALASKNQKLLALCILSDFPGIRNLSGLNDLFSLNNLSGLNDLDSLISSKNLLGWMFPSTLVPKLPFLVSQYGMDHQKSTILLIFGTLSVGGCGGQGCYF
jgi:hypothetical protein